MKAVFSFASAVDGARMSSSGMATSTRNHALELWGHRLPSGDAEKWARVLFCYDNPPGTEAISGSQDAIGIVLPGLNRCYFDGGYWPQSIRTVRDEATLQFLENSLTLIPLGSRPADYDPRAGSRLTPERARELAWAAEDCWQAILARDLPGFGACVRRSLEAQLALFPNMINNFIRSVLHRYQETALGWKLSGAGGGGYLILVSEAPLASALRIHARRGAE